MGSVSPKPPPLSVVIQVEVQGNIWLLDVFNLLALSPSYLNDKTL